MTTRILLVGCGKMGGALLKGWSNQPSFVISTLDPHSPDADYHSPSQIPSPQPSPTRGEGVFDVIVLAVKPQVMTEVTESLKHLVAPTTLILTIAAGKPISFYEAIFGTAQPVIRAMPNLPALIGQGMIVLCGNNASSEPQRQIAMNLMDGVGDTEWIDNEQMMNAVTAVSGSGPAYVFHLIEAMTAAGIAAGLTPALSERLAQKTLIGTAEMIKEEESEKIATLRKNVTSPGGTTEAALKILMADDDGLSALMTRAILAAKQRGEELAK